MRSAAAKESACQRQRHNGHEKRHHAIPLLSGITRLRQKAKPEGSVLVGGVVEGIPDVLDQLRVDLLKVVHCFSPPVARIPGAYIYERPASRKKLRTAHRIFQKSAHEPLAEAIGYGYNRMQSLCSGCAAARRKPRIYQILWQTIWNRGKSTIGGMSVLIKKQ